MRLNEASIESEPTVALEPVQLAFNDIDTDPPCANDWDVETVLAQLALCTDIEAVIPFAFDGTVPVPVTVKPPPVVLQEANPPFSFTPLTVQFHTVVAAPTIANGWFPLHPILNV